MSVHQLIETLGHFYDRFGYLLVFLGAWGENTALLGLVLPGGSLALLGAFYARPGVGTLNIVVVILLAWLGTVLGYSTDYLVGRYLYTRIERRLYTSRLGQRLRVAGRYRLARRFLMKHGGKAILASHLIGHLRSFVALTAGATHMKPRRFLGYELVAALVWNTAFCMLGYLVGAEFETILRIFERAGWVIAGLLVALVVGWRFFGERIRHRLGLARRQMRGRRPPAALRQAK